jgi:nucleotide-binding universal stress UspA family protein
MRSVIGIDTGGTYEPAIRLFARLKFPNAETTLLNVADLVLPYTSFAMPPTVEPMNQIVEGLRQAGETAVAEAAKLAETYGVSTHQEVQSGPSVLTLLDRADELKADVLAVASTRKGTIATMFTGSMSRSIVTGSRHTVLVAKEGVRDQGPVEAVLATDHSPYMERAVDRFLSLAPKGISKLHIVTAYEVSDKEATLLHANLPALDGHIEQWIEGKLREKSEALVGKLSQHGYDADYELSASRPNDAISDAMERTGSELLILGAQGHGFLDRLFVGSVSFHQLVGEPYSVLILRDQ